MPTIHRERGYRFYFNSDEGTEPPHVHIRGKEGRMKVWLNDLTIAKVRGVPSHEQTKLLAISEAKQKQFLKDWYDYFKNN